MHIAQDSTTVHPLATPLSSTNLPRVIWVVFDEFDYRFVFANRPSDLKMPEMDRFAAGSWRATQAFPPGGATIVSIPALLSGKTIRSATPVSERDLRLKLEPGGEHVLWSELPSIFRQARNEGANCGIVGWYHPYGRLFCDSVSWCEWVPLPRFEPARVDSFWGTVERELLAMGNPINQRLIHLRNFRQTLAAGEGLAVNPNCQIAFLHLPVPHKPGIMNGRGQLTAFGVPSSAAYIGNLALADRAFGNIRQTMEKSELWKQSWVVVSSDHFWRVGMGNTEPPDHRIPFIVKAPDAVPKEYDRPFNTVVTGEMVLAVLKRELRSGMQLNDWFDEHAPPPPKTYNETPEGE
jgi:hypothetical protein